MVGVGRLLLIGLISIACSATGFSQPLTGQAKLRALDMAQQDAQRQLLERVKKLELTGGTTIHDFIREASIAEPEAAHLIWGYRVISERDLGRGNMEVTVEIPVANVVANIRAMMRDYYADGKFHGLDIEEISALTERPVLTAVGKGTCKPPTETRKKTPPRPGVKRPVAPLSFWQKVPPEQRQDAERRARIAAYTNLVEAITAFQITPTIRVKHIVLASDRVEESLRAFLRDAEQVGKTRFLDDGTVEVTLRVPVQAVETQLKQILRDAYDGEAVKDLDYEKIRIRTDATYVEGVGRATVDETGEVMEVDVHPDARTKTQGRTRKNEEAPPRELETTVK